MMARMLRYNLQLRYCRVAIVDDDAGSHFAVVFAQPLEEVDELRCARIFAEAAFMADAISRDILAASV